MNWSVEYLEEARNDISRLDKSQRLVVRKAIEKVRANPLPQSEGGYGKPLGNKAIANLSGLLKIKIKALGIRIVYKLVRVDKKMVIVIVGARANEQVYRDAGKRMKPYQNPLK